MSTKRVPPRMNSTVWLLLAAALLRGLFDLIRTHVNAEYEFWPDHEFHQMMYFSGVVIAGLAYAARWRPILSATAGLVTQMLMTTYFLATVGAYAWFWAQPEGYVYVLLCAAMGMALKKQVQGNCANLSAMWAIFSAALIRSITDISAIMFPDIFEMMPTGTWGRLQSPPVLAIVVLNLLVFSLVVHAKRHPRVSLTLALLWQVPLIVFLFPGGWRTVMMNPAAVILLWLAVVLVRAVQKARHDHAPAGDPLEDRAAT